MEFHTAASSSFQVWCGDSKKKWVPIDSTGKLKLSDISYPRDGFAWDAKSVVAVVWQDPTLSGASQDVHSVFKSLKPQPDKVPNLASRLCPQEAPSSSSHPRVSAPVPKAAEKVRCLKFGKDEKVRLFDICIGQG